MVRTKIIKYNPTNRDDVDEDLEEVNGRSIVDVNRVARVDPHSAMITLHAIEIQKGGDGYRQNG
jgi:Cu/Ag efflux protein CusF|tara:strand:- start:4008 stop:4199 length:192 start_codon:yes stop_codon:yes gene_type:complete